MTEQFSAAGGASHPSHLASAPHANPSETSPSPAIHNLSLQEGTSRRQSDASVAGSTMSRQDAREKEKFINDLEAEEERLVNGLTRKLEKLRREKVSLEATLEAESEFIVNKLQRQLSLLLAQQQEQPQSAKSNPLAADISQPASPTSIGTQRDHSNLISALGMDPLHPSPTHVIEALQTENQALRQQLAHAQRTLLDFTRVGESYRAELIELRRLHGLTHSDLTGTGQGPSSEEYQTQAGIPRPANPIPAGNNPLLYGTTRSSSVSETPQSSSSRSGSLSMGKTSPFVSTDLTTPSTSYTCSPSHASPHSPSALSSRNQGMRPNFSGFYAPPPSLASSLTSAVVLDDDEITSPISFHSRSASTNRRGSDVRVAEQGQLQRSRGASSSQHSVPRPVVTAPAPVPAPAPPSQ